jgi:hypothetical protein
MSIPWPKIHAWLQFSFSPFISVSGRALRAAPLAATHRPLDRPTRRSSAPARSRPSTWTSSSRRTRPPAAATAASAVVVVVVAVVSEAGVCTLRSLFSFCFVLCVKSLAITSSLACRRLAWWPRSWRPWRRSWRQPEQELWRWQQRRRLPGLRGRLPLSQGVERTRPTPRSEAKDSFRCRPTILERHLYLASGVQVNNSN